MELYILRHGEAGQRHTLQNRDTERSLTVSGKKEMKKIASSLDELGVKPNCVVSSPLKRAFESAEILRSTLKLREAVEEWDELKPEGNRAEMYKRLGKFKQDATVVMVGHEPNLSTIIGEIICGNLNLRLILKKGGVARVHITSFSPRVTGELRLLLSPKVLKKIK